MSDINPSSMLAVGTVLNGKYRIERHLSSGGFGNTYMATNLTFNDVVAVKEFFMRGISQRDGDSSTISVSNPENRELFTEQLEKFKKEAQRIRQLRSHHIVCVHDLFEANGTAYYVMDYIDGESLGARLKRTNTPLTEAETRKYLGQVLDALETIHGAGLCHMDLKPENIMVDKADNAILIDFGASKRSDNERFTSTVSGVSYTNGYAPPEQLEQDTAHFGPWTDIYALGATLYKLLTNRKPPMPSAFYSDITPDKHEVLPFPEGVSSQMRQVIIQMMSVRWKNRPQSVTALRTMLAPPADEDQTRVRAVNSTMNSYSEDETMVRGAQPTNDGYEEVNKVSSTRKWLYGVIGALLIVLAGVGSLLYINSQKQKAEERELLVRDSIAQVQRIQQARQDSIERVRQDSLDAVNDSIEKARQIEEERQKEIRGMVDAYCKKVDELFGSYFLFDITQDGLPELWVKSGTCEADYILSVFTYNHGLKRIYQEGAGHGVYCQGSNYILFWGGHQGFGYWSKIAYNNGKMDSKVIFEEDVREDFEYTKPKEPLIQLHNDKQHILNLLKKNR